MPQSALTSRYWRLLCAPQLGWLLNITLLSSWAAADVVPKMEPSVIVQQPSPTQSPVQPLSPAQQVFDQANTTLLNEYGGLSTVSRPDLRREFQQRLNLVCQKLRQSCPVSKAYPVLSAEVSALHDEHSFLQDPDEFGDFVTDATGGSRQQFGVRLGMFEGENKLVLEVLPGSSSALAGLQRGDVLNKLDGQPYHYAALKEARQLGRSISLEVRRQGRILSVQMTPQSSSTRDLPRLSWINSNQKPVAVLRIPTFMAGGGIAQAVHEQVQQVQGGGAAAILVDLRGNAGGDLNECDEAVSAFVPSFERLSHSAQGISRVQVAGGSRLEDDQAVASVQGAALWQGPLAVLVDEGSASCSEFFAYEVQYAHKGVVVGEETAGVSNTATRIFPLLGGGALQLTIQNYLKPDGQPYPQHISPDIQASTDALKLSQGIDSMVEAALKALGI